MRKRHKHVIDFVFVLSLMCVFAICGLLVIYIGINVYRNTATNIEMAYSQRTALSYLAKQIRQNDRTDGVRISEVEGQDALQIRIVKDEQVFYKYIYCYDGYLCELYAKDDFEPTLTAGQQLVQLEGFTIADYEENAVTISVGGDDSTNHQLIMSLQSR